MADSTKIVRGESPEKVVMPYKPKAFPMQISGGAQAFVLGQQTQAGSDFVISHLVADRVGITDIHRETLEQEIRAEALKKLKFVEEEAYKEAYELGLIEGTEKAFDEKRKEFSESLAKIDELLEKMSRALQIVAEIKERQMLDLIFQIGKRLAFREISIQPEMVTDLVKTVIDEIQSEEQIVVKVSNEDLMFVESLHEKMKTASSKYQNIKFEAADDVLPGGCTLETNHGMIDATIGTRAQKAWEAIEAKLPMLKEARRAL